MADLTPCGHCGAEIDAGLLVCPHCSGDQDTASAGSRTPRAAEEPAREQAPAAGTDASRTPEVEPCPNPTCTGRVPVDAIECDYCGTAVRRPTFRAVGLVVADHPGAVVPVGDTDLVLGRDARRSPAAQFFAADNISKSHAMIRMIEDRVLLTDLGSTNGTFVNGQRLAPHRPAAVTVNDELRLAADHPFRVVTMPEGAGRE